MEKNSQQKEIIMRWVTENLKSEKITKNYFKREAIKQYNTIIIQMANTFCVLDKLHERIVQDYIMRQFFASRYTAKNYVDKIITEKLFDFDFETREFSLPESLLKQLDQDKQE